MPVPNGRTNRSGELVKQVRDKFLVEYEQNKGKN